MAGDFSISAEQREANKKKITELLMSTKRPGLERLVETRDIHQFIYVATRRTSSRRRPRRSTICVVTVDWHSTAFMCISGCLRRLPRV